MLPTNISGKPVTVKFDAIKELPEGTGYMVRNRDSKEIIPVNDNSFSFVSTGGVTERHFTVEIGSKALQEQELSLSRVPRITLWHSVILIRSIRQQRLNMRFHRLSEVTISVFNTIGQRIHKYNLGEIGPGKHAFLFSAEGLTSGLYFYRIDTEFASTTGKMLFMK